MVAAWAWPLTCQDPALLLDPRRLLSTEMSVVTTDTTVEEAEERRWRAGSTRRHTRG